MKYISIIALLAALISSASAQQQPDPATLSKALAVIQAQRNQALDMAAGQQVRAEGLQEELAKAQAKIKEMESKLPSEKP